MLRKLTCGLVALSFGFSLSAADQAFVGTWKMNVAKSKPAKGQDMSVTKILVTAEGDTTLVTLNGTDNSNQPILIKYTVPTGGGPVTFTQGAPPAGMTDAVERIDDRTIEYTSTMDGKQILQQHIVVSPNHKTMIIKTSGINEKGQAFKAMAVFDRQ